MRFYIDIVNVALSGSGQNEEVIAQGEVNYSLFDFNFFIDFIQKIKNMDSKVKKEFKYYLLSSASLTSQLLQEMVLSIKYP